MGPRRHSAPHIESSRDRLIVTRLDVTRHEQDAWGRVPVEWLGETSRERLSLPVVGSDLDREPCVG